MQPQKLRPIDVAKILEDFITGSGGQWDSDDFISFPIEDAYLDQNPGNPRMHRSTP